MRGVQNERMPPFVGELLHVVDELREIRVGEIGDDHPQHFRRTAFQGPGDQVRMISELLSRLSDPELGGLRHFLRAAVVHHAKERCGNGIQNTRKNAEITQDLMQAKVLHI